MRTPQTNDVAWLGPGQNGTPGLYRIVDVELDKDRRPVIFRLADFGNQDLGHFYEFPASRIRGVIFMDLPERQVDEVST